MAMARSPRCSLLALRPGLIDLGDSAVFRVAGVTYSVPDEGGSAPVGTPRNETVLWIRGGLDSLYAAVLPWLSLLGLSAVSLRRWCCRCPGARSCWRR